MRISRQQAAMACFTLGAGALGGAVTIGAMLVGVRREIGRHKQDLQRQRDEDLKAADAWKGETIRDLYQTVADQFARGVLNPDGSQSQPRLSSVPPLPKAVPEETRGTSD